mgnify:CR=1 FL=1
MYDQLIIDQMAIFSFLNMEILFSNVAFMCGKQNLHLMLCRDRLYLVMDWLISFKILHNLYEPIDDATILLMFLMSKEFY